MDEKLIPFLEFIDRNDISGVRIEVVRSKFPESIVKTGLDLGFITISQKDSKRVYILTKAGYDILGNSRGRRESKSSNKNALIVAILALIVAILALIVSVVHFSV